MKKIAVWLSLAVSLFSMAPIAVAQETPTGSPGFQIASPNAGPASASDSPNPDPRWGLVNWHELNMAMMGFTPLDNGTWSHFLSGWSYRSGGTNTGTCTNVHLPSGASLQGITTWTNDTDAVNNITYTLYSVNLVTNVGTNPFSFTTSGAPGIERLFRTVSPAITINNDRHTYAICIFHGTTGSTLQSAGATFWYHLQVNPAPATASFTDVPTSHWAFQFIQALRTSGITSGCTATTYCPDAGVTRAEMAVFLSRALGLAWPDFVP